METKLWMDREPVETCEELEERANDFLAALAARGGRIRETHTATGGHHDNPIVLLTIVYDEVAEQ